MMQNARADEGRQGLALNGTGGGAYGGGGAGGGKMVVTAHVPQDEELLR